LPSTATATAKDLLAALKIFFSDGYFPSYQKNQLYLFGESYGGKYVVALADVISKEPVGSFNLQGVGLGNAWVVPNVQERIYAKFGYTIGMANYYNYIQLNQIEESCNVMIMNNSYYNAQNQQCIPLWLKLVGGAGNFNAYDYRLLGNYPFLNVLQNYLSSVAFIEGAQLKSSGRTTVVYEQCSSRLFENFNVEFQQSYMDFIQRTVAKYKVLVYNGQFDIRCCVYGTSEWLRVLPWSGRQRFNYRQFSPFTVGGAIKGLYKTFGNLTQAVIYSSGHLVPMDAPQPSLEMMARFTTNRPLAENCAKEPCTPVECPNKCSNRGSCNVDGSCTCAKEFSGEDCSVISRPGFNIGTWETQTGSMFGRTPHLINLFIPQATNSSYGTMDIQMEVKKTSTLGKLQIYVAAGYALVAPDETTLDNLAAQFPYRNLEDLITKRFEVNLLPKRGNQFITILIYNSLDIPADYQVTFGVQESGPPFDVATLAVGVAFGISTIVALGMSVFVIIQCLHIRAMAKRQQ
jgi:hypothetical protein